ncbi:feline leukemia virus subgroup C receptor-related protein 2-like [Chrysoperla carnea]|uniref:feline leukemia virus subgroup C receptor-related protein 2-like n=1 Tax=Chrysoperla carnea TaxID=189513 RepID=UPI001D079710|nr:feline leukemia virus subgroup C receptor-related protein 2-like [Chrysoperla carnea]
MDVINKKSLEVGTNKTVENYRVYKRRWFILFIFFVLYFVGSIQWIQYTIIEDVVMDYYGVSASTVNLTSVIFLLTYLPLIVPVSYVINKKGIRFSMIVAATGHCIGSWIKVFSTHPNGFWIGFVGQTFVAVTQVFVVSMPAKFAGIWFDSTQMSTACTIAFYGSPMGIAMGYLITPKIVKQDRESVEETGNDLFLLFLIIAIATTVVTVLIFVFFQEAPHIPPSEAQNTQTQKSSKTLQSYKNLLTNGPFMTLLCAYALNIGVYNATSTLFNPILLEHFEGGGEFAGHIGVVFILSGIFSTVLFGVILDKTKRFKETTLGAYTMTAVGLLAYTFSVNSEHKLLIFLATFLFGFFANGYIPVAYEMGVELTYPESEFNSTGVLSTGSHTLGGLFTIFFTFLLNQTNGFWTNMGMVAFLVIGLILTICTPNILKRQNALKKHLIRDNPNVELAILPIKM